VRCFIGIDLDPTTRDALVAAGAALRAADTSWSHEKWVRAENLHVTVAFLGEVDEGLLDELTQEIAGRLAETFAFEFPFGELRAAPKNGRATMLWAAYRDPDAAGAALVRAIAASCEPLGITLEDRAFKPHVTLVRARRPRRLSAEAIVASQAAAAGVPRFVSVPSATLFASTLTRAGPIYRRLATWEFRVRDA
jgi:2'-5' RNA ligase